MHVYVCLWRALTQSVQNSSIIVQWWRWRHNICKKNDFGSFICLITMSPYTVCIFSHSLNNELRVRRDGSRRLKVDGVHENRTYRRPFTRTPEFGEESGTLASPEKKWNLGLAEVQFPLCWGGLLTFFLVDLPSRSQFPHPLTSLFYANLDELQDPYFQKVAPSVNDKCCSVLSAERMLSDSGVSDSDIRCLEIKSLSAYMWTEMSASAAA